MPESVPDRWASGDAYEPYVGRWSRVVAAEFLGWLGMPRRRRWVDVGCGTGALTTTILRSAEPESVAAFDAAPAYAEYARRHVSDARATFTVADARALPDRDGSAHVAVSGLVLNFVPEPERAAREMRRIVESGGVVAAYVWDYAGRMELMRYFWDAARALDPAAVALDEGERFPICRQGALAELFTRAGIEKVVSRAIDVPTHFRDFDQYWTPFLGGQGPAPSYAISLDERRRLALRDRIRAALPTAADGSIALTARAWAVQGERAS
jgi:SAM-dependent methyltransferase